MVHVDYTTGEQWFSAEAQTKWTYFLLGCAILLPWNALINATSFFLSRMAGSGFYPTFSSYMSTAYTLANLVFQSYSTITSKQSSPSRRIFVTIIVMILLVTSLCFSTFIRGTPLGFFSFALFSAATLAAASGYQCTAVYAGAALLGAPYLQTVISGQAAVAVAVSVVQVVSTLISLWGSSPEPGSMKVTMANAGDDQAEEIAARIFFGVSTIFLCIILAAYAWLTRRPFYKSVISTLEPHYETGDIDERTGLVEDDRRNSPTTKSSSNVYRVFKQNVTFMFSIAYVFAVTLAVYPAITVRVRSVNLGIHPMLFTAIHFLVFNVGDLVGRYACSFPRLIVWSAKKILVMSLLRTLFVPLFLLCNVQQSTTTIPISPIISSDTLFMVILLAMGYTNGYVSSIALLAVSSLEHNPRLNGRREDVDVAATLGGSFVIVGLASGALSSFGVQSMI
ncbi:nucleoside transporter-domain-containing protein [Boletus edulis BED1]|uniref:Nucleoside transporter-domain-containing protein n=1 Tax=Boletus edulis BED1 TaxID=1328754 RepID=A0AAD4C6W3_BOLED|nr:nucleoside transporter-domain-containing protein [Boletus edulis BED1]